MVEAEYSQLELLFNLILYILLKLARYDRSKAALPSHDLILSHTSCREICPLPALDIEYPKRVIPTRGYEALKVPIDGVKLNEEAGKCHAGLDLQALLKYSSPQSLCKFECASDTLLALEARLGKRHDEANQEGL